MELFVKKQTNNKLTGDGVQKSHVKDDIMKQLDGKHAFAIICHVRWCRELFSFIQDVFLLIKANAIVWTICHVRRCWSLALCQNIAIVFRDCSKQRHLDGSALGSIFKHLNFAILSVNVNEDASVEGKSRDKIQKHQVPVSWNGLNSVPDTRVFEANAEVSNFLNKSQLLLALAPVPFNSCRHLFVFIIHKSP